VVAEASDGVEAVTVVAAELPELVLMDLSMPLRDGFEATAHITAAFPSIKVVVITLFDDEASVVQALEAGASGYVSKQANPDQIGAVDAVFRGAMWLGCRGRSPSAVPRHDRGSSGLTPRGGHDRRPPQPRPHQPMIAERLCLSAAHAAVGSSVRSG